MGSRTLVTISLSKSSAAKQWQAFCRCPLLLIAVLRCEGMRICGGHQLTLVLALMQGALAC